MKREKGITLIALVVTIVVLIILAAVSISMLTGENGIIKQASNAKDATEQARVEELVDLAVNILIGENQGSTNGITPEMVAEEVNEMEDRDDIYAEGNTFPTNIIFPEEGRKVEINLTEKENLGEIYDVDVDDSNIAPPDLFNYQIIDETEIGATILGELPTKKVAITGIKEEYCNSYKESTEYTDTNYEIIYEGTKISDTLVIPYQVEIDNEMYTIIGANLFALGDDGVLFPKVETVIYPNTIEYIYGNREGGVETNTTLKTVILPNKLKSLDKAFIGCSALSNITIPDGLTYIGDSAFKGCSGLINITIPDSVTEIEDRAFSGCSGLTKIIIPDSVTSIGMHVFEGCTGLTNIIIPNSIKTIRENSFEGCTGLKTIKIPDSVTSIGSFAFMNCTELTSLEIPNTVTSIGYRAFEGCTNITSITIPNSVTSMGEYVFAGWTPSQIINISFIKNQLPYLWKQNWDYNCNATINYLK